MRARTLEVGHLEHVGAALGRSANDLRRVDLLEVLGKQELAEELTQRALHAVERLVRHRLCSKARISTRARAQHTDARAGR